MWALQVAVAAVAVAVAVDVEVVAAKVTQSGTSERSQVEIRAWRAFFRPAERAREL